MQYGAMSLKSSSGLNELFQTSRVQAVNEFESALKKMATEGGPSARL